MRGTKSKLASLVSRSLLAAMVAAAPSAALAAEDLWLKIGDIRGEATDDAHKDEIALLSYSQSFTNPASATGTGGREDKTNCGSVKVTKFIDKSSPNLIAGVTQGKVYPEAVIVFRKGNDSVDYYKVTLTNALLDSIIQTDASPTNTLILEQVSISATKFKFEYTPVGPDGKPGGAVTFGWDCVRNRSF